MKLTARIVKQNNTTFYETVVTAEELIDEKYFRVDRWSPTGTGYQRELNINHVRNIARYLQGEENTTVLPTSVILNSRKPLKVTKRDDGTALLDVSEADFPLFITDGQHRIEALKLAQNNGVELDNYEMAVTITQFSLDEEIQHFRKINTSANKAPKGLDQQLRHTLGREFGFNRTREEQAEDRAVAIVTRLVTDEESPWFDKIALGGQRRKMTQTSTQAPLVRSMITMFQKGRFSNPEEDMNEVYRIFSDFWKAVEANFPHAMESPAKYNIQRSPGFNAWHNVLAQILNVNLKPSQEQMTDAIRGMKEKTKMDDSFWGKNRGQAKSLVSDFGTRRGYQLLGDQLWYNLDKGSLQEPIGRR
jgi:DGQHR domain-containing protein